MKDASPPGWVLASRIAALLVCALALLVAIPNLGSVTLPNHSIAYGKRDVLAIVCMTAPPVVILVGAVYSRAVEYIGWALAFALLICFVVAFA